MAIGFTRDDRAASSRCSRRSTSRHAGASRARARPRARICAGFSVLEAVLDRLELEEFVVSERDILHGAALQAAPDGRRDRAPVARARRRRATRPDRPVPRRGVEQRTIVDTYLDTADAALREGGGRLRLRTQNGRRLATFKRSLVGAADGSGAARRSRVPWKEIPSAPTRSSRRARSAPPRSHPSGRFTPHVRRGVPPGPLAVEAVVDHLRYPDGSTETRVEAEGTSSRSIAFAQELARVVAGIEPALTTKGAELERRLGD